MAASNVAPPVPAKTHLKTRETKTSKESIKFFHRMSKKAYSITYKVEMPELKVFKATSSELICSIDLSKVRAIDLKNGVVVALRLRKAGKKRGKSEQFRFKESHVAKEWVSQIKGHITSLKRRATAQATPSKNSDRLFGEMTPRPRSRTKKNKSKSNVIDLLPLPNEILLRREIGKSRLGVELRKQSCSIVGGPPMASIIVAAKVSGQGVVAGMAAGDVVFKAMGRRVHSLQQFADVVRDQTLIRLEVCRAGDPAPLLAASTAETIAVNFQTPGADDATPYGGSATAAAAKPPIEAKSPFASIHAALDGLQNSSIMDRGRHIDIFSEIGTFSKEDFPKASPPPVLQWDPPRAHSTASSISRASYPASTGRDTHSRSMGRDTHSRSMGRSTHSSPMGRSTHSPSMGRAPHSRSMGRAIQSPSMGRLRQSPSMGRVNVINDLVEDPRRNAYYGARATRDDNKWVRSPAMRTVPRYGSNHQSYSSPSMRKIPTRAAPAMNAFADVGGMYEDELDSLDDGFSERSYPHHHHHRDHHRHPRKAPPADNIPEDSSSNSLAADSKSSNTRAGGRRHSNHSNSTHGSNPRVNNHQNSHNSHNRHTSNRPVNDHSTHDRHNSHNSRRSPPVNDSRRHADTRLGARTNTNSGSPPAASSQRSISHSHTTISSTSSQNRGDTLEPCDHFRPRGFSKRCKTCGKSKRLHRQKAAMIKGFAVGDAVEAMYKTHWYPAVVVDLSLLHKGRYIVRFPRYNIVKRLKAYKVRPAAPSNSKNSSPQQQHHHNNPSMPAQAPPPNPTREGYSPQQQQQRARSWQAGSSESTNSVGFSDSEDEASINAPYGHAERGGYHPEEKTRDPTRQSTERNRSSSSSNAVVPTAASLAMLPTTVSKPVVDEAESLASKHPSLTPSVISSPAHMSMPDESVSIADLGAKFSTLSSTISGLWHDRKGLNQKFNKVHSKLHGLGIGLRNIERSSTDMQEAMKHSERLDEQLGRPKYVPEASRPRSILGISIPTASPHDRDDTRRIYRGLSTASLALLQPKQNALEQSPMPTMDEVEIPDYYSGGIVPTNSDTDDDDDKDMEWFDVADHDARPRVASEYDGF